MSSPSQERNPRYYVRGELVKFEEDQTHEFKGHRNISIREIPPWCVKEEENFRTRNAASRYLEVHQFNGFSFISILCVR
jgi:hypothetical protein